MLLLGLSVFNVLFYSVLAAFLSAFLTLKSCSHLLNSQLLLITPTYPHYRRKIRTK